MAVTQTEKLVQPCRRAAAVRAPGLDGLRALAVLAVLIFHQNIAIVPAGFLGVDVFFVLSGYLITDLLAGQWEAGRRIDLRGFWVRRARRLLPALAVMLLVVTAAVAVIAPAQASALRPALLGALTYTSNWSQAVGHQSYFATFGPPPPLQHLWSLAVEEQFYLLWPLVLVVVVRLRSRPLRAALAWLGAAASAVAMAAMYVPGSDPSRVYYGTDTHASALLIGAALALTWPRPRLATAAPRLAGRLDAAGVAGLMLLAWAMGHFAGADPAVYPAGLILAALAAGCVVAAAAGPGVVAAMLSWRPLSWLGIRSYGIYLWHWPVIALGAVLAGPGAAGFWAHVAETALPIVLAALSWRWIEVPIMRNGVRSVLRACRRYLAESVATARRSPLRALPVTIPMAVIVVAATAGYSVLHPAGGVATQARPAAPGKPARPAAARAGLPAVQRAGLPAASRTAGRPAWPAAWSAGTAAWPVIGIAAGPAAHGAARVASHSRAAHRPGRAAQRQSGRAHRQRPGLATPHGPGRASRHGPGPHGASPHGASPHGASPHGHGRVPRHGAGPHGAGPHGAGHPAGHRVPALPGQLPGRPAGSPGAAGPHRHVRGTSVTAIGDSVMLAAAAGLQRVLPGIYIDALVSRQMSAGLDVARSLAESGRLRRIVVVGLGTNGTVTGAQIRQLRTIVGPRRRLVLVNTFVPRPWQDEVNGALAAAARRHPHVVIANWLAAIEHRTSLLWDDGVHPRPAGGLLYARVLRAAIRTVLGRHSSRP